jgi:hypothetical protein
MKPLSTYGRQNKACVFSCSLPIIREGFFIQPSGRLHYFFILHPQLWIAAIIGKGIGGIAYAETIDRFSCSGLQIPSAVNPKTEKPNQGGKEYGVQYMGYMGVHGR